jgi:putative membrane protein
VTAASLLFAGVAAAVHVMFFVTESVLFMREPVYRRFGTETVEEARAQRVFALNQGFYNLFLAIGAAAGIALAVGNPVGARWALVAFCCGSMAAAAVVLAVSKPDLARASGIQGAPPVLALLFMLAA